MIVVPLAETFVNDLATKANLEQALELMTMRLTVQNRASDSAHLGSL